MSPDDIPASVAKLAETAPNVAMTDTKRAAWAPAHFWPAIREHFAREVHKLKSPTPDGSEHYQSGWGTAIDAACDTIRNT